MLTVAALCKLHCLQFGSTLFTRSKNGCQPRFDRALRFLHGSLLAERDHRFSESYVAELETPSAWAALSWLALSPEPYELQADIPAQLTVVRQLLATNFPAQQGVIPAPVGVGAKSQ